MTILGRPLGAHCACVIAAAFSLSLSARVHAQSDEMLQRLKRMAASNPALASEMKRRGLGDSADGPTSGSATSSDAPTEDEGTSATAPARTHARIDEQAAIQAGVTSTTVSGDIVVGYVATAPDGAYSLEGNRLHWQDDEPGGSVLWVTLQDAATSRPIPGARVTAAITRNAQDVISTVPLSLTWGPKFTAYRAVLPAPSESSSTAPLVLTVRAEPPTFTRTDRTQGAFFAKPIVAQFHHVVVPVAATSPADANTSGAGKATASPGFFQKGRRPYVEPTPYPGALAK